MPDVPAHEQNETHRYPLRFPPHPPRAKDPHYPLFEEVKRRYKPTAKCWYADKIGSNEHCQGGLELHHWVIENAVINEVDATLLDKDYPGAGATPDQIDAWVQSHYAEDGSGSLIFLCAYHHRGTAGVHVVDFASWKAAWYAPELLPDG